ncbi:MAG TPA: glutathione S-transferase family protein [Phenylobacterium sp.]|uniref:glutathione S-transferase family protein n=1 Tax=Phenylobacterium sp. TaxID=1871053 RepID=UPI002B46472F|nr:glutathione S-transferase family protein [Phenylobacterium sp.]HKR89477.1 glutathione S-transferase family protein [Phenylobacterium sp.]
MIVIYGSSMSPFVRKAMVFAIEKGIPFDPQPGGSRATGPDFAKASPFGKIPAMKDGDFMLADSTAIVTYFDAIKPEPNLIPLEPKARARTIFYEEFADTLACDCGGKIFFTRVVGPKFLGLETDPAVADQAQREQFPKLVDYLERVIPASGYLVEDRFTLADIAVASPFATMAMADCVVDPATHPKTAAYLAGILARPSFAGLIEKERAFLAA